MQLAAEIALVTGASRGIGQAIALELGRRGATVIGTATTERGADAIAGLLTQEGIQGVGMVLDVSDRAALETVIAAINERLGAPTILVNNAGITRDGLLLRMSDEDWNEVLNTDLSSVFRTCKLCLRGMLKARRGRIVNVASVVGLTGNPGQSNYAAAKAGIVGFTKSLAQEVGARGITVNTVAPGFIETDMTRALSGEQREALLRRIPLNRFGSVEDVAAAVAFLCSASAGYITGTTLHVNGGMFMP